MAVTPLWVAGAEDRSAGEVNTYSGVGFINSTSTPFTGSRSYAFGTNTGLAGSPLLPDSTHIRLGWRVRPTGLIFGGTASSLHYAFGSFRETPDGAVIFGVGRRPSTGDIIPVINNAEQTAIGNTAASINMTTPDVYHHIGMICQIGAPGYAAFFVDGALIWDATVTITGTIKYAIWGLLANNFIGFAYADDIYVDDIAGEANLAPPMYRFPYRIVNGVGADDAWSSTTAANWQAVDENPRDNDTTYNHVATDAQRDTFAASSMGSFPDHTIVARHLLAHARRTGADGTLKLHSRDGAGNYLTSTEKTLNTDYTRHMETQFTMPDGVTAFTTEAALDATQIGYESDGFV